MPLVASFVNLRQDIFHHEAHEGHDGVLLPWENFIFCDLRGLHGLITVWFPHKSGLPLRSALKIPYILDKSTGISPISPPAFP